MRKVQLYIEGNRIELFNDEQIQVTSSIQNVQDISKTYTDFSQGFTVPASDVNNAFFEHWYNSDIDFSTDNNLRKDAYIEINLSTFRKGKVQLDGASLSNGKPSSYNLTFYGEGVTLKDLFGEDLLSDLDYTAYSHNFTAAEVLTRITNSTNTYDVKYPLITSYRVWEYQSQTITAQIPNTSTGTSTNNNIHNNSGAITKTELFPAFRDARIFDLIESKYGITFSGAFLQDERFTNLFLWYKGKEQFVNTGNEKLIDIQSVSPPTGIYDLSPYIDTTTDTIKFTEIAGVITHVLNINILTISTATSFFVDIYQNGNLFNSIELSTTGVHTLDVVNQTSGMNIDYQIYLRPTESVTITHSLQYSVIYISSGTLVTETQSTTNASSVLPLNLNLAANAPVMKIADFFSGILKTFNMTTYSITDSEYFVEPLDDWYSKGAVVDVSEYVDVTSIEATRMPLYKAISFKYQDSECVLNKYYSTVFSKNYGDTTYEYNYDGGEFTVELPFENLLQQKFTGTDLQVGYSLNKEFAPYIPKPVLLYQYTNKTCDFKYHNDGGGHSTVTSYTPLGQDLIYNTTNYTLNFAPETSSLLSTPIQNTLFANYYFSYLYNLYNLKQRLLNVKARLPVSLLTGLQLNDRLVIRDRRYIINEIKTNLTTGDADLQLILDFRPIVNSTNPNPKVSTEGGTVKYTINLPNNAVQAAFTCSNPSVSFSPNPMTTGGVLIITLPSGAAGTVYTIVVTYTYLDGSTTTESFYIIQ